MTVFMLLSAAGYCNMMYANSNMGIILNGLNNPLKRRKENYTHGKKSIKEVEKSHREIFR